MSSCLISAIGTDGLGHRMEAAYSCIGVAAELGLLDPADVQMFRPYGMESFAILTALHYGASALYFAAEAP